MAVLHLRVRRGEARDLGVACSEKTEGTPENTSRNVEAVTCKRFLKKLEGDTEIINPATNLPY